MTANLNTHFNNQDDFFINKKQYLEFRKAWARAAQATEVTAAHHLLYNILRHKRLDYGFTPTTNKTKLLNGAYINAGLESASWLLHLNCREADRYLGNSQQGTRFPFFGRTPTQQDLLIPRRLESFILVISKHADDPDWIFDFLLNTMAELDFKRIKPVESNFGRGGELARQVISGERRTITYDDIWELYEESA